MGDSDCAFWLVTRITSPDQDYTAFKQGVRGNVVETRHVAKPSLPAPDIVTTSTFPLSCSSGAACNKPLSTTDANGNTTYYTYDTATGAPLTETRPAVNGVSPQTRFTYAYYQAFYKNSAGVIGASGVPVQKLIQVSECRTTASCGNGADETKTLTGYGPQSAGSANNLLPVTVRITPGDETFSATTTRTYDGIGNMVSSDGPLPGTADTTHYFYAADRHLAGTISPDPDGAGGNPMPAERVTYDVRGRPVKTEKGSITSVPAEGTPPASWSGFTAYQTAERGYNANDQKTWDLLRGSDNAIYSYTQYSYDPVGRPKCTAARMNVAVFGSLPADACGQSTGATDRITKNIYDAAGQLIQTRRGLGATQIIGGVTVPLEQAYVTYSYSGNGKQEYVIDANGNRAQFVYDGFDRLYRWQFPSTTRPAAFIGDSQATALSSAGSVNTGDYEQYGYDANGNRTSLRKRDGSTISYTYDPLNRMSTQDAPGTANDVSYSYDLQGHQLTALYSSGGLGVTSQYDALGRLTASTATMGGMTRVLAYQYDAAGNRTRITHPDNTYFTYDYDVLGRPTAVKQSGSTTLFSYTYDAQSRRTTINRGNGASVATTSYFYDGTYGSNSACQPASGDQVVGRLTCISQDLAGGWADLAIRFAYNPANQVVSRTTSNNSYAWTGHYNVNRTYTPNGLNQYTAAGPASFTYDANGNLTSDGSTSYAYDTQNKLVSASGAHNATLSYDPMGRLFQVAGGSSGSTQFLYDGDALVAEYDGAGNLLRRYVHGPEADEPQMWYEGNSIRYLHADHQGSIVAISDASGNPVGLNAYDEYGIPQSTNLGRFQYTGQIWLPELGLYHYKARAYSPTLGRFMQTDPVGYKDQFNLYAYVANDPVNGRDPFGLNKQCTGDTSAQDDPTKGQCQDDGQKPDKEDEIVVTAKRQHKIRLSGPEQFFSVSVDSLKTFNADSAEDCGGFGAYHTNSANFGTGDPGHSHPDGSSDDRENTAPFLGPDDGTAANQTGRAYMVSPIGVTRIQRLENGTYTATLVEGQFGASDRTVVAQLSKFNRNAGSQVPGGATKAAEGAKQCTAMRTH